MEILMRETLKHRSRPALENRDKDDEFLD